MASVAKKINQLHTEFMKGTVEKAVEIGRLLTEEKVKLGHGNWEDWMGENLEFSASTAKRYMRLYEVQDELKTVNMTDLSLTEIYNYMNSRTKEEHEENTNNYREQDKKRDERREAFADREHTYNNPEGYEDQIICGNSLEVMQKMLDEGYENTYDLVITSPPYGNGIWYGSTYIDNLPYAQYLEMIQKFIELSYKLLRKGGRLILNIDDMTRKDEETGDRHHTLESDIVQIIRTMGIALYEFDRIIWYKKNSGSMWRPCFGSNCSPSSPKLRNKFETILIYSKEEHTLPNTYNTEADITKEEFQSWTFNVWDIHPSVPSTVHPAVYTEKLIYRLVKLYSFPKCKILDPFCGSGTTCKVSHLLGRSYTGIEINPNYSQYSRDRIDLTASELRDKYAEYLGGKKTKTSKESETPKLVVSTLENNDSLLKESA